MSGKTAAQGRSAWAAFWVILIGLGIAAGGAYLVYKYRLRVSLDLYMYVFFPLGKSRYLIMWLTMVATDVYTVIFYPRYGVDYMLSYRLICRNVLDHIYHCN